MTRRKSENMKLTMPVNESRDHIQGPASAPVTLLEYGDYECPYCAQTYIIIKEAQERLGSKLRFVFRNFPVTNVRPHAYETALAAEAAAAQGKFWEMYDYLFKHGQWVTNDNLRQSAAKLGLGLARFDRDFLDRRYSSHIDKDIQSAKGSGVKSTPTFFINEDRYNGAWVLDSLLGALDEESVFSWRQANK
jgi:protein-disulfide isomerase